MIWSEQLEGSLLLGIPCSNVRMKRYNRGRVSEWGGSMDGDEVVVVEV